MPSGTKVDNVYKALIHKGFAKANAARIAQSKTHEALATGKPPKHDYGTSFRGGSESGQGSFHKGSMFSPAPLGNKPKPEQKVPRAELPAIGRKDLKPGHTVLKDYAAETETEDYEAGGLPHPPPGENGSTAYESEGSSVISPDDIQQIVAALLETEQMKWVTAHMDQGPEGAAEHDGDLPGEEEAQLEHEPPPMHSAEEEGPPMGEAEKKHYECMSPELKKHYSAFRKEHSKHYEAHHTEHKVRNYEAEKGSVIDDKTMREDKTGSVGGEMEREHHSRRQDPEAVARYRRLEDEVKQLRTEQEKLRRERDAQAFKAREAQRYSRLQARSREYAFELADEWDRIKEFGDKEFDAHVDGTIVQHYQRMPLGIELPSDEVVGIPAEIRPSKVMVDKYARQQKDRAIKIAQREGITFDEAWEKAGESTNGQAVKK